jgi:hypothetical protein
MQLFSDSFLLLLPWTRECGLDNAKASTRLGNGAQHRAGRMNSRTHNAQSPFPRGSQESPPFAMQSIGSSTSTAASANPTGLSLPLDFEKDALSANHSDCMLCSPPRTAVIDAQN